MKRNDCHCLVSVETQICAAVDTKLNAMREARTAILSHLRLDKYYRFN